MRELSVLDKAISAYMHHAPYAGPSVCDAVVELEHVGKHFIYFFFQIFIPLCLFDTRCVERVACPNNVLSVH